MSQTQSLANKRYFLVTGWINPKGESAHVVVVAPGESVYNKTWGGYIPNVMDTGGGMCSEKQTINYSFGKIRFQELNFINTNKMKRLILVLTMCIVHFMSYAQEQVFTVDNDQIKSKPQFIEAFENGEFTNITSHSLQRSYNIVTPNGDKYIVKCFKNTGWENEPGDWHYLEIAHNGQRYIL